MGEAINGLWIGKALGPIERLSITSFLARGHPYHLYCYEPIANVPPDTIVMDASEILPAASIFRYRKGPGEGSLAAFADLFRYKLLLQRGGWWCDLDVVCLKPFTGGPIVFSSERTRFSSQVASAVIRLPPSHEVARRCFDIASNTSISSLRWGDIGPTLLDRLVRSHRLGSYISQSDAFCPLPWWKWNLALCPDRRRWLPYLKDHSLAVHLWHELWRRAGLNGQVEYPTDSMIWHLQTMALAAVHPIKTGRADPD